MNTFDRIIESKLWMIFISIATTAFIIGGFLYLDSYVTRERAFDNLIHNDFIRIVEREKFYYPGFFGVCISQKDSRYQTSCGNLLNQTERAQFIGSRLK